MGSLGSQAHITQLESDFHIPGMAAVVQSLSGSSQVTMNPNADAATIPPVVLHNKNHR